MEVVHFTVLHPGKLISFTGVDAADDIACSACRITKRKIS